MSSIKLTDEEFGLLDGVTNLMFRLYVVLRRHMDYGTGKAGEHHRIRWSSIDIEMNVNAHRGVKKGEDGRPGIHRLKRAGTRLVKIGLLESLSIVTATEKQLIFFFPLADRGQSVKTKAARKPLDSPALEPLGSKGNENNNMNAPEKVKPIDSNPPSRSGIWYPVKPDIPLREISCPERQVAHGLGEGQKPVILIPLISGDDYPVTEKLAEEFQKSFPAVDVAQELRAIRSWNQSNPTRKKTKRGIRRHINSWLERKQNQGGQRSPMSSPSTSKKLSPADRIREALQKRESAQLNTIDGESC